MILTVFFFWILAAILAGFINYVLMQFTEEPKDDNEPLP
jgi:phosphate/sulfate permease